MKSKILRIATSSLCVSFALALAGLNSYAQTDPNPDSPAPVLISEEGSTRALTSLVRRNPRDARSGMQRSAFQPGSYATLFVTNLDLIEGEGANSIRVWAEDGKKRVFRFPIVDFRTVPGREYVYAVSVLLRDEIGYFDPPTYGDLLINVAWRGMSSNKVRLAYGAFGGAVVDEPGAVPTPFPLVPPVRKSDEPSLTGEYRYAGDAKRLLEQASFGPSRASEERVRMLGLRGWLNEQFKLPYSTYLASYPTSVLKSLDSTLVGIGCGNGAGGTDATCIRDYYSMYPLQNWFYKQAMYGDQQLRHRTAWALSQIWVTSGLENNQSGWMIEYHKILSKHAFGNWRNLMYDMTVSPAMGNYLDMVRSTKTNPNENYGREILQLFNVGLFLLNQDGTLQRDGQGNPIDTYTQAEVDAFTKVFTGWSFCETTGTSCPNRTISAPNYKDPMLLATGNHDLTSKTLLNYSGVTTRTVAACTGCTTAAAINTYAGNSLNQALDNIFYHPNTAPFVSKLLIQNLVTSDPSPAYVGRVSAVFTANRTNPVQMQEVLKAILLDPEARGSVKTDTRYGKLREPVILTTNLLRQFDALAVDGVNESDGVINGYASYMLQNTFNPTTVFNYYPFEYVIPGTTIPGPEFGIYNTGSSVARLNIVNAMVYSQIGVGTNSPAGTKLRFIDAQAVAAADPTSNRLVDYLSEKMLHRSMSPQMRTSILTAVNAITGTTSTTYLARAQTAAFLIASSSQYQVQR